MNAAESARVLAHYAGARSTARRFRDRASLEAWQDRQVRAHLAWVLPRSAFYRERFAGLDLEGWRSFPRMDKAAMMAGFDALNTAGVSRDEAYRVALAAEESRDFSPTIGGVSVGLSSGTSGTRGLFLVSDAERLRWAGYVLAALLPGSILGRHRIAFFLRADSNLYRSVGSSRIRFEFFDLMLPAEEHLARLAALDPDVLAGPPSMLRLLAEAKASGSLPIAPARVISVAEALDPIDERAIASAFGGPVYQAYQCTEGFLGRTCAHGTLHLNEDIVVVQKEWLDQGLRKFSPIVTDFRRRTQPILRYRLDDILTERAEPCPCGSPMTALETIEGRCDDVFVLPDAAGSPVRVFPDFIRRAVITASAPVAAYRVVQDGPAHLTVHLDPLTDETREAVTRSLADVLGRLGAAMPALAFAPLQPHAGPKKLKRVERAVDALR